MFSKKSEEEKQQNEAEKVAKRQHRLAKMNLSTLRINALSMNMRVTKDGIVHNLEDGTKGPIKGAKATLETEGELRNRITATRVLATGVFALALKKKTSDVDVYVTVEHPDYEFTRKVGKSKKEQISRDWVHAFNDLSKYLAAGGEL